jgi:hypothetical protein
MAEHILKSILRKSGVTHPGEERSNLREMYRVQMAEIQEQFDRGRISRDVALDAMRHVFDLDFQETVNDPPSYRAALQSGWLETQRQTIGGWDENITPEAAAEKRRQAFAVTLGHRADDFLQAGALTPSDYVWAQEQLDPGSISDARARNGYTQTVGIDEVPRSLDENELAAVAATAFYKRAGRLADLQPPEPEETVEEHAGDYTPQQMERFVQRRNKEDRHHANRAIDDDPVADLPSE